MANWKLGKLQYGFVSTATSAGTLTLTSSSKQIQVLTGTSNHTVKLPDATTMVNGVAFTISNQSTGTITINYNDNSLLYSLPAGNVVKLLLTDASTSNGVWRSVVSGGAAGIGAVAPGSVITTNYTVLAADNGRVLNVDTSSAAISIQLPAPSPGFKVTIKDYKGNSANNIITIKRNASENIDFTASDDEIKINYKAVSVVSDGTDWYRVTAFTGAIPANTDVNATFSGGQNTGGTPVNVIDYVDITSLGNATDFGDLTVARNSTANCGSATRGITAGGFTGSSNNTIDYITFSTTGNAIDFGDITVARHAFGGCSSSTRGTFGGGFSSSGSVVQNIIDYITMASAGNATDFGDLTVARYSTASCSSTTRGLFAGGNTGSSTNNTIDYITIASPGNATDFGDISVTREGSAGASSSTRGLFAGGAVGSNADNTIDYVTIASTGNATDFGDLTEARYFLAGGASSLRAVFAGGSSPGIASSDGRNTIDYVTIASTGNATDFGDLTVARTFVSGMSSLHGGL